MKRSVVAFTALLVVDCAGLTILTRDTLPSNDGLTVALSVALIAVGLVIARQQPRNPVSWLLAATGAIALIDVADRLYLVFDYRQHHGSLPLGWLAVEWRGALALTPFLIGLPAILLFPDGRVPSRRWRAALRLYVIASTLFVVLQFAGMASRAADPHPGVNATGQVSISPTGAAGWAWLAVPFFLAFWVASVVHQARSWRRADGEHRAQLKWLMSAGAVCVASSVTLVITGDKTSLTTRLAADASTLGIAFMPVAIGIAILRYRLYEIDRLISRTISYAIVTGMLVGTFVGLIVLTTDVLPFSSPVGVAASTLAAAALFNTLRVRVQRLVDLRFNRARYDTQAILAAFSGRLRDTVDLAMIETELFTAVNLSLAPDHASLWIKRST